MSQERVELLEGLLSRVQENRRRARTPAGLGLVQPAVAVAPAPEKPAPVAAAPAPAPTPVAAARPAPAPVAPPMRSAAPAPAKPAPIAAAPAPRAPAAVEPPRRGQDRSATPLEMAVAELDLASSAKPAAAAAPAAGQVPMAPPISPEEAFAPRIIEPEPIREPARPIAQVVSRHAPQVDATFGAMLKRSLSLRPH